MHHGTRLSRSSTTVSPDDYDQLDAHNWDYFRRFGAGEKPSREADREYHTIKNRLVRQLVGLTGVGGNSLHSMAQTAAQKAADIKKRKRKIAKASRKRNRVR